MARGSHCSSQTRQTTPFAARQPAVICAVSAHGRPSCWVSAGVGQASAQSPQKLHSAWRNDTSGKPARPRRIIFSGQASIQASQRVHSSTKAGSATAQGGRGAASSPLIRPRRKAALLMARFISFTPRLLGESTPKTIASIDRAGAKSLISVKVWRFYTPALQNEFSRNQHLLRRICMILQINCRPKMVTGARFGQDDTTTG